MTNPTETIKALRDALTRIAEFPRERAQEMSVSTIRNIACKALALTADASEDAPDHGQTVLRVQKALGITDTGWVSPDVVLHYLGKAINAARPAPVAATPAPDAIEQRTEDIRLRLANPTSIPRSALLHYTECLLAHIATLSSAAPAAPIAEVTAAGWIVEASHDTDFTNDQGLADYWKRKGRNVEPLYRQPAAEHAKPEPVERACHWPECVCTFETMVKGCGTRGQQAGAVDGKRYRTLRDTLMGAVGGGIEVNDEKLVYQEAEIGQEVRIYWYPVTPVGFHQVFGSTLDEAADNLIEDMRAASATHKGE